MNDYDAATYGERIAAVYDTWHTLSAEETEQTVPFLAELAGTGPALELGIGTGRVALPLTQRGIAVAGIDASEAMVARLRTKPGGEAEQARGRGTRTTRRWGRECRDAGRRARPRRQDMDHRTLTKERLEQLLRDAEQAHGAFESSLGHRDENWPAWYADYIIRRLNEPPSPREGSGG